jgi:two-component system, chemotaxis family, sensor kinase CheA
VNGSADPYRYFRVEARELITELSRSTLALERGDSAPECIATLLRAAHTLKGAARVVKQLEIADLAHRIEELLAPYRSGAAPIASVTLESVLSLVDAMSESLGQLDAPRAKPAAIPTPNVRTESDDVVRTVRTDVGELDRLLDGLGEAHVSLGAIRKDALQLERTRILARALHDQLSSRLGADGRTQDSTGLAAKTRSLAEELRGTLETYERRLLARIDEVERELGQARSVAERLRLLPAGVLFSVLERTARDVAHALGKEVRFEATGGNERMDASVLSLLQGALVQLVRNAVAHGIEMPDERRRAGKPAAGSVVIDVVRRGGRVAIRCVDDGRGLDLKALGRAASEKGIALPRADGADSPELFRQLLRAGISTTRTVTPHAGRGVGLDVVRESIERLRGDAHLERSAVGTSIVLEVPISLASLEVLLVETRDGQASIPLESVERVIRVVASEIVRHSAGDAIEVEGSLIAFAPLERLLHSRRDRRAETPWTAVVVSFGAERAAIGVERIRGTHSAVIRPLPEISPTAAIIAGAALDADGNPQLVLDMEAVVHEARRPTAVTTPSAEQTKHRVLVVDDSLTTRMLEQSILETAGYEVDLAASGEEGLEKAKRQRYAAFLVDVEMPGIDGFTFVERASNDPAMRGVPAILVTSRSAPEDKQRAEQAGARGYIVKGEFDQRDLLRRLHALVS